jgi:hypothetical protein
MSESFIENYKAKHRHPLNKLSHSIGIPLIVISLPLFFFKWRWALGLFIVGWAFQFLGHLLKGTSPLSSAIRFIFSSVPGGCYAARSALSVRKSDPHRNRILSA